MSNLCRDESCMILEDKIEYVFGSCFSTHGLGGVLTCGVIGMGAGLSHSPVENVSGSGNSTCQQQITLDLFSLHKLNHEVSVIHTQRWAGP
jgi:hypothetical protein